MIRSLRDYSPEVSGTIKLRLAMRSAARQVSGTRSESDLELLRVLGLDLDLELDWALGSEQGWALEDRWILGSRLS